jgi:hypothetical protein
MSLARLFGLGYGEHMTDLVSPEQRGRIRDAITVGDGRYDINGIEVVALQPETVLALLDTADHYELVAESNRKAISKEREYAQQLDMIEILTDNIMNNLATYPGHLPNDDEKNSPEAKKAARWIAEQIEMILHPDEHVESPVRCAKCGHAFHDHLQFCPNMASDNDCSCEGMNGKRAS